MALKIYFIDASDHHTTNEAVVIAGDEPTALALFGESTTSPLATEIGTAGDSEVERVVMTNYWSP